MQTIFKVRNCNAGKCTGIHLHLFKILIHRSDYASTSALPYTVLCFVPHRNWFDFIGGESPCLLILLLSQTHFQSFINSP